MVRPTKDGRSWAEFRLEKETRQVMISLDKTVDAIGRIAAELPQLYREAARQYGTEVEAIVRSGSRDVKRIEQTLDGLLDFAADRDCLELFRRLCRHYWDIDPAATAGYVHAYREMWDSDEPGKEDSKA